MISPTPRRSSRARTWMPRSAPRSVAPRPLVVRARAGRASKTDPPNLRKTERVAGEPWRLPRDRRGLSDDRVDRREGRTPPQDAHSLLGCDAAHGPDRLLRIIRSVRCDDNVLKLKQRVGRAPVSLFSRLLLDVIERRAGNPSPGEGLVDCGILNDGAARGIYEDRC